MLPVLTHRGEHWVAGSPGRSYAIVLRNRSGERLLAVTAVDGVNVLSGETAGWDQSGYVLAPAHRYQVTGWRKSRSEVAAFAFSSSGDAYASRTGRPDHVGVIGVAVFREQRPAVAPRVMPPEMDKRSNLDRETFPGAGRREAPPVSASARDAGGGQIYYGWLRYQYGSIDAHELFMQDVPNVPAVVPGGPREVPLPFAAPLTLLATGAAGLAALRRRRKPAAK